jgi:hypothetical protein
LKNDFLVRENQKCPKKSLKRAPKAISQKIVFLIWALNHQFEKNILLAFEKDP